MSYKTNIANIVIRVDKIVPGFSNHYYQQLKNFDAIYSNHQNGSNTLGQTQEGGLNQIIHQIKNEIKQIGGQHQTDNTDSSDDDQEGGQNQIDDTDTESDDDYSQDGGLKFKKSSRSSKKKSKKSSRSSKKKHKKSKKSKTKKMYNQLYQYQVLQQQLLHLQTMGYDIGNYSLMIKTNQSPLKTNTEKKQVTKTNNDREEKKNSKNNNDREEKKDGKTNTGSNKTNEDKKVKDAKEAKEAKDKAEAKAKETKDAKEKAEEEAKEAVLLALPPSVVSTIESAHIPPWKKRLEMVSKSRVSLMVSKSRGSLMASSWAPASGKHPTSSSLSKTHSLPSPSSGKHSSLPSSRASASSYRRRPY